MADIQEKEMCPLASHWRFPVFFVQVKLALPAMPRKGLPMIADRLICS
jgi:hypothetical protein